MISSFSLGGTTCLAYILFNDSGNSSLFNHFLIRYVCSFPARFLESDLTFTHSKCTLALEMLFFLLVKHILKVANSGTNNL